MPRGTFKHNEVRDHVQYVHMAKAHVRLHVLGQEDNAATRVRLTRMKGRSWWQPQHRLFKDGVRYGRGVPQLGEEEGPVVTKVTEFVFEAETDELTAFEVEVLECRQLREETTCPGRRVVNVFNGKDVLQATLRAVGATVEFMHSAEESLARIVVQVSMVGQAPNIVCRASIPHVAGLVRRAKDPRREVGRGEARHNVRRLREARPTKEYVDQVDRWVPLGRVELPPVNT
jgi:hypothetical protein